MEGDAKRFTRAILKFLLHWSSKLKETHDIAKTS